MSGVVNSVLRVMNDSVLGLLIILYLSWRFAHFLFRGGFLDVVVSRFKMLHKTIEKVTIATKVVFGITFCFKIYVTIYVNL